MAFNLAAARTTFSTLLAQIPQAFTFSATVYNGTRTVVKKERQYTMAGLQDGYDFSIIAAVSDFSTLPVVDDVITVGGTDYRVLDIETDAANIGITFHLGQKYG